MNAMKVTTLNDVSNAFDAFQEMDKSQEASDFVYAEWKRLADLYTRSRVGICENLVEAEAAFALTPADTQSERLWAACVIELRERKLRVA